MGGSLDAYEAQDRKIIEPVKDSLKGSLSSQVRKVWRSDSVDGFHLDQPIDQIL
jgi:hypothetical protein